MLLLIDDAPETIEYAQIIFDFRMLAQYISYDDETL